MSSNCAGPRGRLVVVGLAGTFALAGAVGWVLNLAGLVESPLLMGTALVATSLGLLIPILKDADAVDRPVGQLTIGGASAGEVGALLLSLAHRRCRTCRRRSAGSMVPSGVDATVTSGIRSSSQARRTL